VVKPVGVGEEVTAHYGDGYCTYIPAPLFASLKPDPPSLSHHYQSVGEIAIAYAKLAKSVAQEDTVRP